MKNLIKKFGKGLIIAGLSTALLSCSSKKFAQPSDYLRVDFITDSEKQVKVYGNNVQIHYPHESIPHFRIDYVDFDRDLNVDKYNVSAYYKEEVTGSFKAITGKELIKMYNEEYAEKHKLKNITYITEELQNKINKDYKKLRKKYYLSKLQKAKTISSTNEVYILDRLLIHMDKFKDNHMGGICAICGDDSDGSVDEKDMDKVFYGATGNREISIGIMIFKNVTKDLNNEGNFCFLIDYFDSRISSVEGGRSYEYPITAKDDEHQIKEFTESFNLEELLKTIYEIPESSKGSGGFVMFPATIKDGSVKKQGSKEVYDGKTYYMGISYENKQSGKIEDLILVLKINQNNDKINFECYGNGEKTIQSNVKGKK